MLIKRQSGSWAQLLSIAIRRIRALFKPGARFRILRFFGVMLLASTLLLVFAAGVYHLGTSGKYVGTRRISQYAQQLQNAIEARLAPPPKHVDIHINFKNYQWLAYDREKALERGILVQHDQSYVPCEVELPDKRVAAKVRLKGGASDHFDGDKWSLRFRVKNDTVFGMSFFTLQDPRTRSFIYEWIFHELMRREGLVAPRYDFVTVAINGTPKGVYAVEESFSKELLEAHRRREGPIIRFDESQFQHHLASERTHHQRELFFSAEIDAFGSARVEENAELKKQFDLARDLLERVRDQRIPVGNAIDLDKAATFFALIDLTGANHAARWKNIRFYYNPVTTLLEPMPYDGYGGTPGSYVKVQPLEIEHLSGWYKWHTLFVTEWVQYFFQDPEFYERYVRELDRISSPEYLDDTLRDMRGTIKQHLRTLHKDYPGFHFASDYLYSNARIIRNAVRPHTPLRAHYDTTQSDKGIKHLNVANTVWLDVELLALLDKTSQRRYPFREATTLKPDRSDALHTARIPLPEGSDAVFNEFAQDRFDIMYRVTGMNEEYAAPVRAHAARDEKNIFERLQEASPDLPTMEALTVSASEKTITFQPGKWIVDSSIYIPAGYHVIAGAGVEIDLTKGASLISFSPLTFDGTEASPVRVMSSDASGGGIAVIHAKDRSHLHHTHFEQLASPSEGLWQVTGAITFYESSVTLDRCTIRGGNAEDQLNIIRSDFIIDHCTLDGAKSDALDIDFGEGLIRDTVFTDSINDAIDVSGTQVSIADCQVLRAGDKGVSAGERSIVDIDGLKLTACHYGIASKDLSTVEATNVAIHDSQVGLAAYRKKSEYGPASMSLGGLTMVNVGQRMLLEKGSAVRVDGETIEGQQMNVARQIYQEER